MQPSQTQIWKRRDHIFIRISTAGNVITTQLNQLEEDLSEPDQKEHWEAHLLGLLIKFFGKPSFKPWQKVTISATLEGKNTLVIENTGAGKSLCFQFPCVAIKTLTVVLMPTISLIKDQYQLVQSTGLRATFLGTLQIDKTVLSKIAQMEYNIVLCTPESFYDSVGEPKPVFKTLGIQPKIGLIAIDEVHLVKSWSSFRPAYGFLKRLDKQFKGVPLMALTATATPDVLIELKQLLGGNPICEISTVNKANITYNVHEIKPQGEVDKYTNLASQVTPFLTDFKAIVYVDFVQDVSPIAISLRQNGLSSCPTTVTR